MTGLAGIGAAAAAALSLLAAGCTVGPRYTAPDPAALSPRVFAGDGGRPGAGDAGASDALAATAAADRWWESLGDATLDELVQSALRDAPDLAAAESRVQQARSEARIAGAAFYPVVNGDGQIDRDRLSRHGENLSLIPFSPSTTEFTDYRIGVDASWEIDLFGRTRREVEAAAARLESSQESLNDARAVVAAEVASAYVDMRAAEKRLALAHRTRDTLDETLRLIGLQERAGLASESARRLAEADASDAAAAIPSLESARRTALFELASLTALTDDELSARLGADGRIPSIAEPIPIGLPLDVLRRRPDVRRAERELAAATADVGSAVAARFPRVSLVGDFGFDSVKPGDLTNAASRYWDLGPQLSVPLFAGGKLRANEEAAGHARDAAQADYRATVLKAIADAESAIVRYTAERRRDEHLNEALAALNSAFALERRRFTAGDASRIEVLAAERAALGAADLEASSRALMVRNYIALGKALGGGWQRRT